MPVSQALSVAAFILMFSTRGLLYCEGLAYLTSFIFATVRPNAPALRQSRSTQGGVRSSTRRMSTVSCRLNLTLLETHENAQKLEVEENLRLST